MLVIRSPPRWDARPPCPVAEHTWPCATHLESKPSPSPAASTLPTSSRPSKSASVRSYARYVLYLVCKKSRMCRGWRSTRGKPKKHFLARNRCLCLVGPMFHRPRCRIFPGPAADDQQPSDGEDRHFLWAFEIRSFSVHLKPIG